jgi:molybdenum cofactor cytidylyltransferase
MSSTGHASRFFAIVPAAGRSVRMGRPKLLLPWGDATLVEQVLTAWRASRVNSVVVVVHPDDVKVAGLCRRAGAEVVTPRRPPEDMKASVGHALAHIGAQHAPTAADAWLLAPADMPGLSAALIDAVIAAHDAASPRVVVPTSSGRRGHPVLFPWSLAGEVPKLAAAAGLKELVNRHQCVEIAWPNASAFADVDTPEDYHRLRDANPH